MHLARYMHNTIQHNTKMQYNKIQILTWKDNQSGASSKSFVWNIFFLHIYLTQTTSQGRFCTGPYFSKKGFSELRNSLLMPGKLIIPWQRPGQWTRVSSRCNLCPLGLGYRYPVLLNLKPAEPAPVCQLDASKTTLQWLSEAVAAPKVKTTSACVNSIIKNWKMFTLFICTTAVIICTAVVIICTTVNKLLTFFFFYWYHIREDEYWVDTSKDLKAVLYNKNP